MLPDFAKAALGNSPGTFHDVKSLINLIGERQFIDRLNAGFATSEKVSFNALGDNMGAYPINHGNETNMQAAYLLSLIHI